MPSFQSVSSRLGSVVLFPFLLPLFFVLHIERYYTGAVPVKDVVELGLLYVAGTVLLYMLLRLFIRQKTIAGFVALSLAALFLWWGEILQAVINTFHFRQNYSRHPFFLLVFLIIISLGALLIRRQQPAVIRRINFYFNVLLLLYVGSEAGLLAAYALTGRLYHPLIDARRAAIEDAQPAKAGKDIYLLVFDEYASSASLSHDWNIDNSDVDHFLEAKGFKIIRGSRSNYNFTQFSMTSLLNMDYLQGYTTPGVRITELDYQYLIPFLDNPRAVNVLKRAGYKFTSYSIFDIAGNPQQQFDGMHISKRRLITNNTFYKLLVKNYLPYLSYRREIKSNPAFYDSLFYRSHTYNNNTVRQILMRINEPKKGAQFVYAHFMIPHEPYYYDTAGNLLPIGVIEARPNNTPATLAAYHNNIRVANRIIKQLTEAIHTRSNGNAVILVMGDHGYRIRKRTRPGESFPNFNAVYFPDGDYGSVPDSLTNVNEFRMVLNKCCGTHYPMLPNKCVFLHADNDYPAAFLSRR